MELSEQEVLLLLQTCANKGNKPEAERAFERLYLEFHRAVRNYVWKSISQDLLLIEEITQDTFFEVWQHGDRFRGEAKFKTWLLSIARFKALDALRKRSITHETIEDIDEHLMASHDSVADGIQQEQVHQAITTCLDSLATKGKLSAAHKEVLHLVYIEDFDIDEVAQFTGSLESTVKTRLFYARQQIKNCLKKHLFGENTHG